MKISIITVCYNSEKTLRKTIESVLNQDYDNIEYIIVDGGSNDKTIEIINEYRENVTKFITEKDEGIYDAINKGILQASGEVLGILNSDDIFYNENTISIIAKYFNENYILDSIIGDIIFINKKGHKHRHYSALNWTPKKFAWGIMPPHPSFYCKRSLFNRFGLYRIDFKIAADFELLVRFLLINKVSYEYIPEILVQMNLGGISTKSLKSNFLINNEVLRACIINNVNTNIFKLYSKYLFKFKELL